MIRDNTSLVDPELLVISDSGWESRREIDLLYIDKEARPIVIELKRGHEAHMKLQAIRYAAMVSTMTFEAATNTYQNYLRKQGEDSQSIEDAEDKILSFPGWDEPRRTVDHVDRIIEDFGLDDVSYESHPRTNCAQHPCGLSGPEIR